MASVDFAEVFNANSVNDFQLQNKLSNQMFINVMASNLAVHSRCGQVLDKRVAEFDIEENRAYSSIDPSTQSYLLNRAGQDNGSTNTQNALLIEILRQIQAK
jgi:hypothetical protein